jgi:hypothetical protein
LETTSLEDVGESLGLPPRLHSRLLKRWERGRNSQESRLAHVNESHNSICFSFLFLFTHDIGACWVFMYPVAAVFFLVLRARPTETVGCVSYYRYLLESYLDRLPPVCTTINSNILTVQPSVRATGVESRSSVRYEFTRS